MRKKDVVLLGLSVVIGLLVAYIIYAPDEAKGDPVESTLRSISALHDSTSKQFPKTSIKEYRNITEELIRNGSMPKSLVKNGKGENLWGGRIVVQVFPQNAWKAGVPATINYVLESIPEKECSQLVEKLGRQPEARIFQINLEPSKKVHGAFPVTGNAGCSDGVNNIGYTVYAK